MRHRLLATFLAVTLLATLAGAPAEASHEEPPGRVLQAASHPFQREAPTVIEHKVPLVELFTATWCPPCAPADRALERLIFEEDAAPDVNASAAPAGFTLLAYHPFPDTQEDVFGTPEGHARMAAKHDAFWFPSLYVDGTYEDRPASRSWSVDAGMEHIYYGSYRGLIETARTHPANVGLTVTSTPVADAPGTWDVHVRIEAKEDIPARLFLQAAVWEDPIHFRGSNGIDTQRMVVRALAPRTVQDGLETGSVWEHAWRIVVPAQVDPQHAGITVFIETAWGESRTPPANLLFSLAAAVALGVGVVAAIDVRAQRRRRGRART